MPCQPERVTAYVDRELAPSVEHVLERHLSACPACAAQAAFEIELQATLTALPAPRLRPGFPATVLRQVAEQCGLGPPQSRAGEPSCQPSPRPAGY